MRRNCDEKGSEIFRSHPLKNFWGVRRKFSGSPLNKKEKASIIFFLFFYFSKRPRMQVFNLHKRLYKLSHINCTAKNTATITDPTVQHKYKLLQDWSLLKHKGIADSDISRIIGISRATYYRRKKIIACDGIAGLREKSREPRTLRISKIPQNTIAQILQIRQENPTYGKAKIALILHRDYCVKLSQSSVGRILHKLRIDGRITRSISCGKRKRRRKFTAHARRWEYGAKATIVGEMVQIDHMTVTKNGICIKHFKAYDPISKIIVADVVSNATSSAAAKFLDKIVKEMPFVVKSVQVDGGSEFMRHFEQRCEELGIALFVLPPNRPQYNGGVERGNRIFREEFYARKDIVADSVGAFKVSLRDAVHKYNNYRPHFSLQGMTPYAVCC